MCACMVVFVCVFVCLLVSLCVFVCLCVCLVVRLCVLRGCLFVWLAGLLLACVCM